MRMCMDMLRPNRSSEAREELELAAKSVFLSALPVGLQEMLQAFLISNPDADWDKISSAGVRYAKIRKVGTDTTQAIHNSLATAHATQTAYDPMAMEIDNNNLTLQINNLQASRLTIYKNAAQVDSHRRNAVRS